MFCLYSLFDHQYRMRKEFLKGIRVTCNYPATDNYKLYDIDYFGTYIPPEFQPDAVIASHFPPGEGDLTNVGL